MSDNARSPTVLGVAVGPDAMWAVPYTGRGTAADQVGPRMIPIDGNSSASLTQAFQVLEHELSCDAARLHIALLPPLVQARRIELPRLKLDEVRRVLAHNASKYFFGARERQIVGARVIESGQRAPMTVFALAAAARTIDALYESAARVGWTIDTLVSAYVVWASAVGAAGPKTRTAPTWIVHRATTFVEGILVQGGHPTWVRRCPATAVQSQAVSQWLSEISTHDTAPSPRVAVLGVAGESDAPLGELGDGGVERVVLDHSDTPPGLAAAWVGRTSGIELLPDRVRSERVRKGRRLTAGLSAAAVLLIAIAATVELLGERRELTAIQRERTSVAEQVGATVAEREGLLELNERLAALAVAEESAPRWSRVIANVAENLPDDAHLLAFRANADSLVMEGLAERAAGVFEAMQAAPDILGVRARAPIRRELLTNNRAIERFALGAQLRGGRSSDEEPK